MTARFIALCEERLGLSLREDTSLFHGLLTHLEPALYRLRRQMEIHNPILGQIKQNYPELFTVAKEVVAVLLPELQVPEEEVGYLVMHLGQRWRGGGWSTIAIAHWSSAPAASARRRFWRRASKGNSRDRQLAQLVHV